MKLTKRTILITGGGAGIGLALAKALLARGNRVIVTGRDSARLSAAAACGLEVAQSDVAAPDQIVRLHEEVLDRFPALDVLVNNAGVMRNLTLADRRDLADVTREIDVLLSGPIRMTQQFLPHLLARESAAIVNVSSGLAFVPMAAAPVYSAAKAAVHAYTRALRAQLASSRVKVIELAPPPVETALFPGEFAEETRGRRAMSPERLAQRTIAAIEQGKVEIAPSLASVLRLASRLAPEAMFNQLSKESSAKFRAALAR